MKVIYLGYGPGYFTTELAKMVGEEGRTTTVECLITIYLFMIYQMAYAEIIYPDRN
jgi:hypothetical protein